MQRVTTAISLSGGFLKGNPSNLLIFIQPSQRYHNDCIFLRVTASLQLRPLNMMGVETNGKSVQLKKGKPNGHIAPRPSRTNQTKSSFIPRYLSLVAKSVIPTEFAE